MKEEIKGYLANISSKLRIDPTFKREIIKEIYTHIEEKIEELCRKGLKEEEAIKVALKSLGQPQFIGKWICEVYNQGSWGQALLAALPHILFASLFLFQLWQSLAYFLLFFSFAFIVSAFAWWRGKPFWVFPWLGYALIPLIAFIFLLPSLTLWGYLALAFFLLFCWRFLFYPTLARAVEKDWLYGTLMLLPYPLFFGWLIVLKFKGILADFSSPQLEGIDLWIALTFLTLGLMVIAFTRFSQNQFKSGVLFLPELIILFALSISSSIGFFLSIFLILFAFILLFSPALLRRRLDRYFSLEEEWVNEVR